MSLPGSTSPEDFAAPPVVLLVQPDLLADVVATLRAADLVTTRALPGSPSPLHVARLGAAPPDDVEMKGYTVRHEVLDEVPSFPPAPPKQTHGTVVSGPAFTSRCKTLHSPGYPAHDWTLAGVNLRCPGGA